MKNLKQIEKELIETKNKVEKLEKEKSLILENKEEMGWVSINATEELSTTQQHNGKKYAEIKKCLKEGDYVRITIWKDYSNRCEKTTNYSEITVIRKEVSK